MLRETIDGARRGVVVAGRDERVLAGWCPGQGAAAFAAAAGWPLLADPMSGARSGSAAIAHYDALLRDEDFVAGLGPDLVLRVGDLPVSKPLRGWLAGLGGVRQIALDREAAWQDPAPCCRTRSRSTRPPCSDRWPRRAYPSRMPTGSRIGAAPTRSPPRRSSACSAAMR